jgi:hypothetical protein
MPGAGVQRKARASWRAKLHKPQRPQLVAVSEGMAKRLGHGMMLIPTALEIDAMVRKIPYGELSTLREIRKRLARWHRADVTCPLVSGIFLRTVAEAAEEDRLEGKADIAPYWRVVRDDGRLNAKFPGGLVAHAFHLMQEGHGIEGDRVRVEEPAGTAA